MQRRKKRIKYLPFFCLSKWRLSSKPWRLQYRERVKAFDFPDFFARWWVALWIFLMISVFVQSRWHFHNHTIQTMTVISVWIAFHPHLKRCHPSETQIHHTVAMPLHLVDQLLSMSGEQSTEMWSLGTSRQKKNTKNYFLNIDRNIWRATINRFSFHYEIRRNTKLLKADFN